MELSCNLRPPGGGHDLPPEGRALEPDPLPEHGARDRLAGRHRRGQVTFPAGVCDMLRDCSVTV